MYKPSSLGVISLVYVAFSPGESLLVSMSASSSNLPEGVSVQNCRFNPSLCSNPIIVASTLSASPKGGYGFVIVNRSFLAKGGF